MFDLRHQKGLHKGNNSNSSNMGDNDNQQEAPKKGNKLENPDSIPSAGGQKIGEEHQGESKMLGENSRSESVDAAGNADGKSH